jgi:hypothetical protein
MVEQWRRVPLVEAAEYIDERGQRQTAYKIHVDASREIRELLKQIAQELGEFMPSAPAPAAAAFGGFVGNGEEDVADQDIRADLQELLSSMAERDVAAGTG